MHYLVWWLRASLCTAMLRCFLTLVLALSPPPFFFTLLSIDPDSWPLSAQLWITIENIFKVRFFEKNFSQPSLLFLLLHTSLNWSWFMTTVENYWKELVPALSPLPPLFNWFIIRIVAVISLIWWSFLL